MRNVFMPFGIGSPFTRAFAGGGSFGGFENPV